MVECPTCHTSNPPESRQCSKCSAPFGIDSATLVIESPVTSDNLLDPDGTQVFTEVSLGTASPGGKTGWSVPVQKPGATDPGTSLQPGMMLGERYEILKSLGEGGMG